MVLEYSRPARSEAILFVGNNDLPAFETPNIENRSYPVRIQNVMYGRLPNIELARNHRQYSAAHHRKTGHVRRPAQLHTPLGSPRRFRRSRK